MTFEEFKNTTFNITINGYDCGTVTGADFAKTIVVFEDASDYFGTVTFYCPETEEEFTIDTSDAWDADAEEYSDEKTREIVNAYFDEKIGKGKYTLKNWY